MAGVATSTIRVNTKQITVRLKMPRLFGLRMWAAIQFIKIAALFAPVTIEVASDHD